MSETIAQTEPDYLRERLAELVESWRERAYEDSDDAFASGLTEAREGVEALLAGVPAETRDPADDAAWPLPEGWAWRRLKWGGFAAWHHGQAVTAWCQSPCRSSMPGSGADLCTDRWFRVPLVVVRTLLARWEAGQA
jgi:hypothetical protein